MSNKKKKSSPINQVLTQLVLDVFEKGDNKPLNYKQVSAKLNITETEAKYTILDILKEEAFKQILK
jgi:ribonuclease R